jgi:hypothetical protein
MIVHHIKMNPIGASGQHVLNFLAKFGKISGQN